VKQAAAKQATTDKDEALAYHSESAEGGRRIWPAINWVYLLLRPDASFRSA